MIFHDLLHKHYQLHKDEIGTFAFCESRLPEQLGGRVHVGFSPAFDGARWHPVPCVTYNGDDSNNLLTRMLDAGTPHQAMAMLRAASEEDL